MRDEYEIKSDEKVKKPSLYSVVSEYGISPIQMNETETGSLSVEQMYEVPLSVDLDIFENISDDRIQTMPRVSKFLSELRSSIVRNSNNFQGFHYNKLTLEEPTRPGELMIDWIYNYFRAFFSFDDKEGDMYGLIVNNTETRVFKSEFEPLTESKYNEVAAKSVKFITENLLR